MSDLEFHTFGCKVNTYDTGLLEQRLTGLIQPEKTKVHIINSCAVTAEATTEALRRARQLKRATPGAYVVLTGCSAQVDSRIVDSASEIDLVIANSHKTEIQNIVQRFLDNEIAPLELKAEQQKVHRSNIFRKEDLEPGGGIENQHTRSFLKIQDGCNSFCSFCVIPYARGKSRSLSQKDIIARIHQITAAGIQEIVLTGIHLGDYLDDETGADFTELIRAILGETSIARLRLSSLEPIEISIEMLKLFSNDRLCPHFHMSIQSASTKVLADMKRKYSSEDVRRSLEQIKSYVPHAFIGMDVIVGFPSESRAHFEETYLNLSVSPWSKIHVFPYSERQGTRAALMTEKVELRERKQRAVRLRELSDERLSHLTKSQLGSIKKVLILNKPARGAIGLSRDYFSVDLEVDSEFYGKEISAEIIAIQNRAGREPLLIGQNRGLLT